MVQPGESASLSGFTVGNGDEAYMSPSFTPNGTLKADLPSGAPLIDGEWLIGVDFEHLEVCLDIYEWLGHQVDRTKRDLPLPDSELESMFGAVPQKRSLHDTVAQSGDVLQKHLDAAADHPFHQSRLLHKAASVVMNSKRPWTARYMRRRYDESLEATVTQLTCVQ
jgi:hypothetical protein